MSGGEVICEYKGKYTSLKVHPFEDASQQVFLEGTLLAEYSGRLAADGTATIEYYGVLTTADDEIVFVRGRGMGAVTNQGQTRVRTTVTSKTAAQQLAWLNITIASFGGSGDFSEVTGTRYA